MLDRVHQRAWQSMRAVAPTGVSAARSLRSIASTARASSRSFSDCPSCRLINAAGQPRPLSLCTSQQRSLHIGSALGNRPGPSRFPARKPTPLDDITRLRELINRANATNSKLSKERILAEFNDLVPLLAFLYDPYTRLHVTSSSVHSYLRQRQKDHDWQSNQAPLVSRPSNSSRDRTRAAALRAKQEDEVREQIPDTLLDLFQLLASRQITGHEALAVIGIFLHEHGIIAQHEYALSAPDDSDMSITELFRQGLLRPTSLEIFYRCLDRNLKAGFGGRILHQTFATASLPDEQSKDKFESHDGDRNPQASVSFRGSFEVALGRTITREELPSLFSNDAAPQWYASRKLDGVRCLFTVHFRRDQVGDDAQAKWKVASIEALSRNGRPFTSLAVLEKELAQKVTEYPGLHDLLEKRPEHDAEQRQTATLVLDGEVCILRPPEQASKSAIRQLDASLSVPTQDTTEGTLVEDFAAVVGLIKRKNFTIREPAFFPFDLLTLEEFTNWRSSAANGRTGRTFSQRLGSLESLVSYFEADARQKGKQSLVRKLSQNVVSATSQVEEMLATASQRGWEGLVLRQDTLYEGKRTSAIRKFKEWRDAEYMVKAITVATMRLPISGRFEEREAMASIQIEHKGTSVSVGSGFTPEQRVEFASDPDKIIGKVVTVEYFDESKTTAGASDGEESSQQTDGARASQEVYSLRFPRLKQIWGGERDL
ncbi:DNA_LIGASE_A3 domain-containing protein [Pseudozyma hubeiensis]|nr:DNA_LIGASE_A3 domain-containing protein [Pseudozyma hubeiensis]